MAIKEFSTIDDFGLFWLELNGGMSKNDEYPELFLSENLELPLF